MSVAPYHASSSVLDQAVRAHMSGDARLAESLYRQVLLEHPDHPRATQFLGVLLFQSGSRREGLQLLERSVSLRPDDSEAWSNLGNAYRVFEKGDEAMFALRKAIDLNPSNASAYCTLSACLRREGTLSEAIGAARTAIRLQPGMAQAHLNLGNALLESGDTAGAINAFGQALYIAPEFLEAHQSLVFGLHYSDRHTEKDILHAARQLGSLFPRVEPKAVDGPLKTLGFVSGDFRTHPVAYFLEPLLCNIDRASYHIVLFSNSNIEDAWTARLKSCADEWHPVADLDAQALTSLVEESGIDILIDLAGHTASNRTDVLGRRAAPVQVSWLGYSGTTGLPNMDWILADDELIPLTAEGSYTESVARLPHSAFCFDPARIDVTVAAPPCLASGHVTFGSFNNLAKLSPTTVTLWSDVLKRTPGSRLKLKSLHLGEDKVAARLRQMFVLNGIDPGRIELTGHIPGDGHFESYAAIDIALDPYPYTGATTTVEALHMGVPVVSLRGDRYAARMSPSILTAVGRPEWVAGSKSQYVETAVDLASNPCALAVLRARLRDDVATSPLCDVAKYAQSFCSVMESIWSDAKNSR